MRTNAGRKSSDARKDREDAARQREEVRVAEAAKADEDRKAALRTEAAAREAAEKAERRLASVAFLGQAEKCYRLLRVAATMAIPVDKAVRWEDWQELSRLLGEVVVSFDRYDSLPALGFVDGLQDATHHLTYAVGMDKAEANLRRFAELVRDNT